MGWSARTHLLAEARRGVELPLPELQQLVASAQQVQQRPVVEALVEVVEAVSRRGHLPLRVQLEVRLAAQARLVDEAAVGVGVFGEVGVDGLLHLPHELALQHRPLGRGDEGDGRHQRRAGALGVCSAAGRGRGGGGAAGARGELSAEHAEAPARRVVLADHRAGLLCKLHDRALQTCLPVEHGARERRNSFVVR